ncbi:MAG: MBL fold metallo-hydrolase [Methanomicrobiales archaeon]|nr:MBL fold metallo-hydrolase [Methanomicrobiales archaeon]
MRLTTLIEDISGGVHDLVPQHGLSFLIESRDRTVLFDMGQDGTFIRNAESLGLDLTKVDAGIISHGHYDHGGGLSSFLACAPHAPVYLKAGAGEASYARDIRGYRYIGLDTGIVAAEAGRLTWISTDTEIFPGFMLITDILDPEPSPPGNRALLLRRQENYTPDPFLHELFLVVDEDDGISIITGCGHSGILNMVYTAKERYPGRPVKAVAGGFHLTDRETPPQLVRYIGKALKSAGCGRVITGHCTGSRAKEILREEFGNRFAAVFTGYSTWI